MIFSCSIFYFKFILTDFYLLLAFAIRLILVLPFLYFMMFFDIYSCDTYYIVVKSNLDVYYNTSIYGKIISFNLSVIYL